MDVFIVVVDRRLVVELFDDHRAVHRGHGQGTRERAEAQDMVEHDGDIACIDAKDQPGSGDVFLGKDIGMVRPGL